MSCLGLLDPNTVPRIFANAHRDLHEFLPRRVAFEPWLKSQGQVQLDEEVGDGSENSPLKVESCGKDGCSMGSGG